MTFATAPHAEEDAAMPAADTLDFAALELVCSRLCHDLISPVAAIGNGVELIEEMGPEMTDEALALIAQSAAQARRRLAMFRLAYGMAGRDGNGGDPQAVATEYFVGSRVALDWDAPALQPLETSLKGFTKLALNLLMVGEECLPLGGQLRLTVQDGVLSAVGTGRRAQLEPLTLEALAGEMLVDEVEPRQVQAFVMGQLLARLGRRLVIAEQAPDRFVMQLPQIA